MSTLLDALQLIRSENVGPVTYHNLLHYYGTPADALRAIPELAKRGGRKRPIQIFPRKQAEIELERTQKAGAHMVSIHDAAYPALLKEIPDAPPVLIVKGDLSRFAQREPIGMVGARNASASGCQFARKVARELGEQGVVVVSGLARGLDTAAHTGALETGTIAVIASGIDIIYPKENTALFEHIAQTGAIVSENPIGMEPMSRTFPARNRIIAGLSRGVVVVEASERSGTLITAKDAADYGREVFAVPGSPMDPRCAGTNRLIKEGAALMESSADVLAFLQQQAVRMEEPSHDGFSSAPPTPPQEDELTEARNFIVERLGQTPVLVDEWLAQCDIRPHVMVAAMLELELAGRLTRHANGAVSLTYEAESA